GPRVRLPAARARPSVARSARGLRRERRTLSRSPGRSLRSPRSPGRCCSADSRARSLIAHSGVQPPRGWCLLRARGRPVFDDTPEQMPPPDVIALFGPTGVGKTAIAIAIADRLRELGERPVAVSADALQVYAGLE